jgi:hypothetical protein
MNDYPQFLKIRPIQNFTECSSREISGAKGYAILLCAAEQMAEIENKFINVLCTSQ